MSGKKVSNSQLQRFLNAKPPQEIEDEMLLIYSELCADADMIKDQLDQFFDLLQLPRELYKLYDKREFCIDNLNIVDFDKLIRNTYLLLIYMDNKATIDEMWVLMVHGCGRDIRYPSVTLQNHVLSVKDIQKIAQYVGMDQKTGIVEMMATATNGKHLFLTYLDFAELMGKLGLLRF
ncbi:hypothetical protein TBLA_0D01560 [Henningerozyma blattae CBS 6284]|uniref:DNA repair protein RAD33 n=1 Tax=Henningerozyma blattae (strain ATCC 34711 / CBS 6284 / DSM 70876 / NBRC 10599 / NRRL Y-10934 / UCD 77-7) TaxID=1071380 RepID=I2H2R2_HENB6|nr:hypothetical protein TBLA_0D01560 [Tetrapisispora blattae CBS 6284]CCH60664.1 hypothetical protein TBLA_0D01560 [Tetrapisispora blattae CBS 6284]